MEHAIAITRSQLRQVIENYIAASRVGDTLSYVETAKLSTAEAAESSTERLWATLEVMTRNVSVPTPPRELMLSAALSEAATLLRKYESHHRAKVDPSGESLRKAEVNAQHAARYEALLGRVAEQGEPDEDSPYVRAVNALIPTPQFHALPEVTPEQALQPIQEEFTCAQEFTCAEDLAAGQVVIVNSRGMIEGKRDEADNLVHQVAQQEHLSPDDFF